MDRLFRSSGLYREKWDRPQSGSTYGALTIQKVVRHCRDCYNPVGHLVPPEDEFQKLLDDGYSAHGEDTSLTEVIAHMLGETGFHARKSEFVNAPVIDELPMTLECRVKKFEDGILVGEIVNVSADDRILTDGKIDPKKLKPITYDTVHKSYLALGDKVGNAYRDGLQLK